MTTLRLLLCVAVIGALAALNYCDRRPVSTDSSVSLIRGWPLTFREFTYGDDDDWYVGVDSSVENWNANALIVNLTVVCLVLVSQIACVFCPNRRVTKSNSRMLTATTVFLLFVHWAGNAITQYFPSQEFVIAIPANATPTAIALNVAGHAALVYCVFVVMLQMLSVWYSVSRQHLDEPKDRST